MVFTGVKVGMFPVVPYTTYMGTHTGTMQSTLASSLSDLGPLGRFKSFEINTLG